MVFLPKSLRKRVALLSASILVVAIGVWWMIVPAEPVYQGRPLSEWLDGTHERLTKEQLKTLGPGLVKWLGYQAARSRPWDIDDLPDNASRLMKFNLRLREKIYGEPPTRADIIHCAAASVLGELGPDAAAAVPALLDTVRDGDRDTRMAAADALAEIGPASWPAVCEAIRHGERGQRLTLIWLLPDRFSEGSPRQSDAEFTQMVSLLFSLMHDPDGDIGATAFATVKKCIQGRSGTPELDAGIRAGAEEMAGLSNLQRRVIADVLAQINFGAEAAIPALKALADTGDELTRAHIVGALAVLDFDNPKWTAVLAGFAASPDKELAAFADQALHPSRR